MAKIFTIRAVFSSVILAMLLLLYINCSFFPIIIGFFFYEFSPRPRAHELQIFSSILVYRRVNGYRKSFDEPANRARNRDIDAKLE